MKMRNKKTGFKNRIGKELEVSNWLVNKFEVNGEWWNDENWKITLKYNSRISFFICFIVDPQFEGIRKKGQGIYKVLASKKLPENWNDNNNEISSFCMSKRNFDLKLNYFLEEIENLKVYTGEKIR